jgi:hypothetical protein
MTFSDCHNHSHQSKDQAKQPKWSSDNLKSAKYPDTYLIRYMRMLMSEPIVKIIMQELRNRPKRCSLPSISLRAIWQKKKVH